MYKLAIVRLEGSANREWELTKENGVVEKFYSIEGSPQREGDDERCFDYDPKLAQMLEDISDYYPADEDEVVEFIVEFNSDGTSSRAYETSRTTVNFIG